MKNITLSESTRRALLNYRWPGNVRQLENAIQRGMILNRDGVIYPDALGLPEMTLPTTANCNGLLSPPYTLPKPAI